MPQLFYALNCVCLLFFFFFFSHRHSIFFPLFIVYYLNSYCKSGDEKYGPKILENKKRVRCSCPNYRDAGMTSCPRFVDHKWQWFNSTFSTFFFFLVKWSIQRGAATVLQKKVANITVTLSFFFWEKWLWVNARDVVTSCYC